MRDIPGFVWILGIFLLGASGLYVYSKTAPTLPPPAVSAWESVESYRKSIERRELQLNENESKEFVSDPYRVTIERLGDVEIPDLRSRYVVRLRSTRSIPDELSWFEAGVDVGFMDTTPKDRLGNLRLVGLRKLKKE